MLLRSSSTPVLGSLLSSFSDSPNNNSINNHHCNDVSTAFKHHTGINKLPYHQAGCPSITTISCNSSPMSPLVAEFSDQSLRGFRRAQSEGNLEGLAYASCNNTEEYHNSSKPKKSTGKSKCLMLETIPSFSFYNLSSQCEDCEEASDVEDQEEMEKFEENANLGLSHKMQNMVLSEKVRGTDRTWNLNLEEERGLIREEMHIAKGLGIDVGTYGGNGGNNGGGNGGGGEFYSADGDSGDMQGAEEYYKKMVQENPGNPLFLRNYAQFLYQNKRDLEGAEEYYSRAILADPKDGDILSQYAKLVWELHHDQDRALSYFERAVQAAPEDSHVHAAYASFLWETEEDDDECNIPIDFDPTPPQFHEGAMASASA